MRKKIKGITAVIMVVVMQFIMMPNVDLQNAVAAEEGYSGIEINGYQISTAVQGVRTVYSIEPEIDGLDVVERGLLYGIEGVTAIENMYCGSNAEYILEFPCVEGLQNKQFSDSKTAESYIMTMKFTCFNVFEYTADFLVRAYAKLSDGTYRYSDVRSYSIYNVAKNLYEGARMPNKEGHDYLYDNILTLINPDTKWIDYDWSGSIVKP